MPCDFDPKKSAANVLMKGRELLPFTAADAFDFNTAQVVEDKRPHPVTGEPYAERRFIAVGKIGRRFVVLVYTPKPEPVGFRTISLRPASQEERAAWQAAQP